jgi:hypothetical protein
MWWHFLRRTGGHFGGKCSDTPTVQTGWNTALLAAFGEQDLAFALMIGLADHAVFFHALDQARGAVATIATALS